MTLNKKSQIKEMTKILLLVIILASFSLIAYSASVQFSDQGSNARYNNMVIQNGNLTIEIWDSQTSNDSINVVYNKTFAGVINDGGWNLIIGEEGDLSLDYGVQYWKKYRINGQELSFDSGNGSTVDRLPFQSSLGLVNQSFIKGNQSTSRVVKDSGTNWIGKLLDFILDSIYDMVISVNQTTIHTTGNETKQGDLYVNGTMTATQFVGDGSLLTGLSKEETPFMNTTAQIMVRPGYPGYVNISETLYVDGTNRKVGINNPNPVEALDVRGNISLDGDLKINGYHSITFGSQGRIYVEGDTLIIEN